MAALEVRTGPLPLSCLIVKLSGFRKYPQRGRRRKTPFCFKNEQADGDRHEVSRSACAGYSQSRRRLMGGALE